MSVVHAEPHTVELDAARQFDFWLGEWDCTWVHDGDRCTATNSVYADLGGCVLVENFDGRPSLDLQGLSFSAGVVASKRFTWARTSLGGSPWTSTVTSAIPGTTPGALM